MNKEKTISEYVTDMVVSVIMFCLLGWWLFWILPHFKVNIGFWMSVGAVVFAAIALQQYKYLITAAFGLVTIAIWAGLLPLA